MAACGGAPHPNPVVDSPPGASSIPLDARIDFACDSLDERAVSSDATRGKPTLLAFVTTSSLSSQAQVDFMVAMAAHDSQATNYAVIALESRNDREMVELYKKALSIPFPVAMAGTSTCGPAFGDLTAVPVTLLLDRSGRIVWRVSGRVAKSAEIRDAMRGL